MQSRNFRFISRSYCLMIPKFPNDIPIALQKPNVAMELTFHCRMQWLGGHIWPYRSTDHIPSSCCIPQLYLIAGLNPSEKYESIGMIRNPIYGKIKNGNQTTNQISHREMYTMIFSRSHVVIEHSYGRFHHLSDVNHSRTNWAIYTIATLHDNQRVNSNGHISRLCQRP